MVREKLSPRQTANWDCAGHAEWIYELFWACYTNAYSFSKCLYVWVNLVWGLVLLKWERDYRRMVNTPSFNFISSFATNLRGIKLAFVCPQQRKTLSGFIGGKWGLIACPNETPLFLSELSFRLAWVWGKCWQGPLFCSRTLWPSLNAGDLCI